MKKWMSTLLVVALLMSMITALPMTASASTNLVVDGEFNEALSRFWSAGSGTRERVEDAETGGCVKLGASSYVQQRVSVEAGEYYEVSLSVKTDNANEGNNPYVQIEGSVGTTKVSFAKVTQWTKNTVLFKAAEVDSVVLMLRSRADIAYYDNVSVTKVEISEGFLNGSFENWEDGAPTDGWFVDGAVSKSTAVVREGMGALQVADGGMAFTSFKVLGETAIIQELTGYIKAGTEGATATISVLQGEDLTSAPIATKTITASTAGWQKVTLEYSIDKATKPFLENLIITLTATGTVFFDDFSTEKYTNLVTNGNFENGNTGWTLTSPATIYTGEANKDVSVVPIEGTKYAGLRGSGKLDISTNAIPVVQGKQYMLSFWRCTAQGNRFTYKISFLKNGTEVTNIWPNQNYSSSGGWQNVEIAFYVPTKGDYKYMVKEEDKEVEKTLSIDTIDSIKISFVGDAFTGSGIENKVNLIDNVKLFEISGFAGVYSSIGDSTAKNSPASYTELGKPLAALQAGTYNFRFDTCTADTATKDSALAIVCLYKKVNGVSTLLKTWSQQVDRIPYALATSGNWNDLGFSFPFEIKESDLAAIDVSYYLKAFAWDDISGLQTYSDVAIVH